MFQSPSLRGSGRFHRRRRDNRFVRRMFQSPSLRGSGRFGSMPTPYQPMTSCFNPLHCGSVVASQIAGDLLLAEVVFQSPSLRGSGRFKLGSEVVESRVDVSIPFIAGQWSLLVERLRNIVSQDPGFNPLHCGAVVASGSGGPRPRAGARVSIPFIAGQWSLRPRSSTRCAGRFPFQSPSLRGSGRFGFYPR